MFRRILVFLLILLAVIPIQPAVAWSAGGHHVISVMAFRQLSLNDRSELIRILRAHPRFNEDFKLPKELSDVRSQDEWLIGRAGYWPDVVRSADKNYHRSTWHYELGATLTIGDKTKMKVPEFPGELPAGASLSTQDLHIAQALDLAMKVLSDKSRSDADRAVALSWITHLVADAHQPCHAGSLYTEHFPEGDRGGNSIKTKQRQNLHALWDGLLGDRYDTSDVLRRAAEIENAPTLMQEARSCATEDNGLKPETWLAESRALARDYVYTPEVLKAASPDMEPIDLTESYLKQAGSKARARAAVASLRLAAVWQKALHEQTESQK